MKRTILAAVALVLSTAALVPAHAENFPDKSIRWIVPYPAGGGSDFLARTISEGLSQVVKQPIVVDNKPGGNTAIAAVDTARSSPDGYTVLSADNGTLTFNPVLYSKLSYDPAMQLAPVTLMGRFPMILVVGEGTKARTFKDFIAEVKAKPGATNYASAGAGSPHHLAMEMLSQRAGLDMVHVPYRGAAPALVDVAGGQVSAMMTDLAAGNALIQSGKLIPIAVANATRLPQFPNIPTLAEEGIQGAEAAALVGMVVAAGTPKDRIDTLQKSVAEAIAMPSVHDKLVNFGVEPVGSTAQEYAQLIEDENVRWRQLIKDQGIKLD